MESKYELIILPKAQEDLDNIISYFKEEYNDSILCLRLIEEFENAFERLCYFPMSYPLINNDFVKDKTIRKLIVKRYLVFYKIVDNIVIIVRVLHMMRNYYEIL